MAQPIRDLFSALKSSREPVLPSTLSFPLVDLEELRKRLRERREVASAYSRGDVLRALAPILNRSREEFARQRDIYLGRIQASSMIGHLRLQVDAACKNVVADFKTRVSDDLSLLHLSEDEVAARAREFDDFRRDHHLARPPVDVSTSGPSAALWIIVFLLIESIANGTFFGQSNELGWLGGVSVALVFSAVNLASAGLATHYPWRWSASRTPLHRLGGGVLLVAAWAWIVSLNLGIGHYRDASAAGTYVPFPDLVRRLAEQPFGFADAQSALLVVVGIGIALAMSIKVARLADRYPGYSKVATARANAVRRHNDERSGCLSGLQEMRDEAISSLQDGIARTRDALNEVNVAAEGLRRLRTSFKRHIAHLRATYDELLREGGVMPAENDSYFEDFVGESADDRAEGLPTVTEEDGQLTLQALQNAVLEINHAYSESIPNYRSISSLMTSAGSERAAA